MAWTYILRCSDDSYYVGSTTNLYARLHQHNLGLGSAYTKGRRPVELVWAWEFERVVHAFALEKQIQNWSRAKREALIEGRFEDLPALARGRNGWMKRGTAERGDRVTAVVSTDRSQARCSTTQVAVVGLSPVGGRA